VLYAGAVHRVPRGEVVRAVEHEVDFLRQRVQVLLLESPRQFLDGDFGIELVERGRGFVDFRAADARGAIEDLALQVGEVDLVGIGESQLADAAGGEVESRRATEAAGADDQRACPAQPLLALDPDLGKEDVAAVAEELLVVQCAEKPLGSRALLTLWRLPAWSRRRSAAASPARP